MARRTLRSAARTAFRHARVKMLARPLRHPIAGHAKAALRQGPIVVAGFFQTASGIGQSARLSADALERAGHSPICVDLSETFQQVDVAPDRQLSHMPKAPMGTLILHANAPETVPALLSLGLLRPRQWRVVGYWAWETSRLPANWGDAERYLSEIWTPSDFVTETVRGVVRIPVKTAPHFIALPELTSPQRSRFNLPEDKAVTLVMGDGRSSFYRKNVLGAVEIFLDAVGDDASCVLVVKTRNITEFPLFGSKLRDVIAGHPRIVTIDRSMPHRDSLDLIGCCDILLSPHRSEGFGLTIAEAMARGRVAIATGWSGNTDFMSADDSVRLPYDLVPVDDPFHVYGSADTGHWAEPDHASAVAALRQLAGDGALRRKLGAEARRSIAARLAHDRHVAHLRL